MQKQGNIEREECDLQLPHGPNNSTTAHSNDPNPREQPAIPNGADKRLRDHRTNAREDVPYEIIDRDAAGRFLGHELRQHGRRHREDKHGADAEEEVGDEGHEPEDALFGRPAVPDQCGGVEEGGNPGVLAHAVFGSVHQLSFFVVAARSLCFARHDGVGPSAAEEGGEDVADAVGDVGQADDGGGEVVGRFGEGGFEGDVEEVEGAEGYGCVVDCDEDCGEAQVEDYAERVDEEAFEELDVVARFLVNCAGARCRSYEGRSFTAFVGKGWVCSLQRLGSIH